MELTDGSLRELFENQVRQDEREKYLIGRMDVFEKSLEVQSEKFQKEMNQIAESLASTTKTLNGIRNVLVLFVVAVVASGANVSIDIPKILKTFGVG